jgi:threonine dehydratase
MVDARTPADLTPAAIEAAAQRIPGALRGSPQYISEGLSAGLGRPVVVKVETVNPIGAFKGRGAWLAVEAAAADERATAEHPIVVASTGNFGQAVAYAGRAQGIPVVVFADEATNPHKLARIRLLGADLRITGADFDEAREASERFAAAGEGMLLIDGGDVWTAIGAGSLAMEVTAAIATGDIPPIDAAYVPVGNGALISGVATWLKHAAPTTRTIGVQSEGAPAMTLSMEQGRAVETESAATRAGGIATRVPVPEALVMMADVVDEMRLVSEAEIATATAEMVSALGITAELASGATLAAAKRYPSGSDGAILLIVTGSNAEPPV